MKNKGIREQLYIFLCILMLFLTTSGCLLSLFPFSLNRIVIPVIIMTMIILMMISKIQPFEILEFFLLFISAITSVLVTNNPAVNFEELLYFIVGVIWLMFIANADRREHLEKCIRGNYRLIRFFAVCLTLFLVVTLFLDQCYVKIWGGESYYIGFSAQAHTMASCVCAIEILLFITASLSKHPNRYRILYLIGLLICAFAAFQTGARTFIIPIGIILLLYIKNNIRRKINRRLIYVLGIAAMAILLVRSSAASKFSFLSSGNAYGYTRFIDSITTGRTVIWATDLMVYSHGSLAQLLFGRGFDSIYQINSSHLLGSLWAHNDFINLLVVGGALALVTYILALYYLFNNTLWKYKRTSKLFILLYSIFPAFINGFYRYQNFITGFVFFFCIVDMLEDKNSMLTSREK